MPSFDLRLGYFLPCILVPVSSYPPLIAGFLLLLASIYTTTSAFPFQLRQTLIRITLAPPAILLFWTFGYDTSYNPPASQVAVGMAIVGLYGIMRITETSIVPLVDSAPVSWIKTSTGLPLPIPTSTKERLMYTFDLATSLRGTSWFPDRHWDWAPTPLVRAPTRYLTRRVFLRSSLLSLAMQYLCVDILDSVNKSRTWDTTNNFPITSLSIPEQLVFSLSVCTGTILSATVMYTVISLVAVAQGSSPASWPPMFDRPFQSTSLADFWGRRWHAIFRRVFTRLSLLPLALLSLLPIPDKSYARLRMAVRATTIFALSAAIHIMLMYRLELADPSHPSLLRTFLDPSILAFFLVQIVGLVIEALIVRPLPFRISSLLSSLSPSSSSEDEEKEKEKENRNASITIVATRLWAWGFLLWSGRFWSDVWVKRGLWAQGEYLVGYSLVRGLLRGQWKV